MKELNTDIAVVGGGPAGLTAAVTAINCDASVAVFEKAPVTGGVASPIMGVGNGLLAVQSKLQRKKMLTLTREEAFNIHMDHTHWRVDARLVRAYYDKSASTIDWLEKLGIEFDEVVCHNPGLNYVMHLVKGPPPDLTDTERISQRRGAVIGSVLTARAEELGVKFYLETPVKKLIMEDGRITGLIARDKFGDEIRVNAYAVIIATGGFSDNPKMIKQYTGLEWGRNLFSLRMPGLAGEGVRMAWEVGAAPSEMIMALYCNLPMGIHPYRHTLAVHAFLQPNLVLNLLGERFINEELVMANPVYAGNALVRQKNGCAFNIFDEETAKHYEKNGLYWRPEPMTGGFDNALEELKSVWDEFDKHVFVADSLEELAYKIGINPKHLQKAVAEYNSACKKGRDALFDKYHEFLRPIKQPRYYAGRIAAAGFGSQGGIKINYKTEVLTKDFEVIPGLYAAGADANSIYGDSYVLPLQASMLGFAINSGRIAGENVGKYLKMLPEKNT